jgi:hypothetical protein
VVCCLVLILDGCLDSWLDKLWSFADWMFCCSADCLLIGWPISGGWLGGSHVGYLAVWVVAHEIVDWIVG